MTQIMYGYNYDQRINTRLSSTPNGVMNVNIDNPVTAFGDLRVTELTPQAHLTFPYNRINSDIVTTGTSATGTTDASGSMISVNTGTDPEGLAYFESRDIVKYRSGLGSLTRFTCIYNDGNGGKDGSEQLAGIGDDEDGYFFGYNGTSFGIMRLRGGISYWIHQDNWNLDTFDGTRVNNPSGIGLSTGKINVFQIEYQWLGGGQIQYSIENPDTGLLTPVHKIKYSNDNTLTSVSNPSLPLTGRVKKYSGSDSINIKIPSMGGFVEGKSIITGPNNNYYGTSTITSADEQTIFNLQNYPTYYTIKNRVRVYLQYFSCGNDVNKSSIVSIYKNLTLNSTSAWSQNNTNSVMYRDDNDASPEFNNYETSKLIYRTIVPKDNGDSVNLTDFNLFLAPGDILTVAATPGSATGTITANLGWVEDF